MPLRIVRYVCRLGVQATCGFAVCPLTDEGVCSSCAIPVFRGTSCGFAMSASFAVLVLQAGEQLLESIVMPKEQTLRQLDATVGSSRNGTQEQLASGFFQHACVLIALCDTVEKSRKEECVPLPLVNRDVEERGRWHGTDTCKELLA